MNDDVNPNENKVTEVVSNQPDVNTQPQVNPNQPSGDIPSSNVSNPQPEQVVSQQRVSLVQDKPAIQAVVPNSNINANHVSQDINGTTNVETPVANNVAQSQPMNEVKIEASKSSGGKFQTFLLVILFGGLLSMVIFLPDISNYIEQKRYQSQQIQEVITSGTLKCSYEKSTDKFDLTYSLNFEFTESKLTRLTYVLETRGDASIDEKELDELKAECDTLALQSENLSGVSVSCNLAQGTISQKQVLNYASIDVDEAMAVYTEAGGIYPDYTNGESIDTIEKEMNASGYTCERRK